MAGVSDGKRLFAKRMAAKTGSRGEKPLSDVFDKALVKLQAIIAINTAMTNVLLAKYLEELLRKK